MRRVAPTPISRREFMRVSGVAAAGAVAVACGASGEPEAMEEAAPADDSAAESSEAAPAASSSQYSEAPMLADMVAAGDLPPVDERLPVNPMVMPVAEENGDYGGTFRRGFKGVSDRWGPTKMQDRGLSWYDQNLNMQPRMAESWEINDDASEWTFHLREGMSWSDGTPFTTEAIRWWWEEDETNTTISPSIGGTWVSGPERTPMELEIVDDSDGNFQVPLAQSSVRLPAWPPDQKSVSARPLPEAVPHGPDRRPGQAASTGRKRPASTAGKSTTPTGAGGT